MKKALIIVLCVVVIGGVFAACSAGQSVSVYQNVIRLHILANSDTDTDQRTKLAVRDLVLKDWGNKLASSSSAAVAWSTLNKLLPQIQQDISAFLDKRGATYGVKMKTGIDDFPSRDYNGVTFPSGKYQALMIDLGAAAGHNWWCVMFPPLCLVGDDGTMDMQQYKDLVEQLDDEGITSGAAPTAPVRSWLFDKLFGDQNWDKDFMQWAKEYWLGGDGK